MKLYSCDHAVGARVLALGLPATVLAVTFTEDEVYYRVAFDNGGAHSFLACADVKPPK